MSTVPKFLTKNTCWQIELGNAKENVQSINKHKLQISIPEVQIVNAKALSWRAEINNWAEENTAEPLKGCENTEKQSIYNLLIYTSVIVSTKGEKQAGTTQLSRCGIYICIYKMCPKFAQTVPKCWNEKNQMPIVGNLQKTANNLGYKT